MQLSRPWLAWLSAGVVMTAAAASTIAVGASSCAQTPTNVPVRSLVRSGRMDILCFQVLTDGQDSGVPIPAIPVTADHCAPVPSGVDPTTVPFHLVALVTQTQRGELAVVDLTIGRVVDTSRALPGLNFLPVGQNPTDVVVTPDAQKVFVSAAETNKPAIYMLPTTQILGDSEVLAEPTQAAEALQLPTWPACSLPQAPGRMVLVPTNAITGEAGVQQGYEIVVSMPGNGVDQDALVGVIDTAAFDSIAPGSLAPCPITSAIHLAEAPSALPTTWTPGPAWPNGLEPYADGGVDLFTTSTAAPPVCAGPDCFMGGGGSKAQPSTAYQLPLWQCPGLAHAPDGGGATAPDASAVALTPGGKTHAAQITATDGRLHVWIGDDVMPDHSVIDTGVARNAHRDRAARRIEHGRSHARRDDRRSRGEPRDARLQTLPLRGRREGGHADGLRRDRSGERTAHADDASESRARSARAARPQRHGIARVDDHVRAP